MEKKPKFDKFLLSRLSQEMRNAFLQVSVFKCTYERKLECACVRVNYDIDYDDR